MGSNLEIILQIISIIVFLGGGITFFFKTGEYKTSVDSKLSILEKETVENKKAIEELRKDFSNMKNENSKVITSLNNNLIEIKTKLESLIQYSGIFNGSKRNQK